MPAGKFISRIHSKLPSAARTDPKKTKRAYFGAFGLYLHHAVSFADALRQQDTGTTDYIVERLKVNQLRPLQAEALHLLLTAKEHDTKFIQAPTGVGKDLLPFAMAVVTGKAQLVFVPFVPLIENVMLEGNKFGCRVIKFSEIHKSISMETAAANADCIVLSYEHASRAGRLAQELSLRQRLGWCFFNEAHVAVVDGDFRDFSRLSEVTTYCPQVCCMSATIRPDSLSHLAEKIGRSSFSRSISVSPERGTLHLQLVVTSNTREFISQNLRLQCAGQRAIIFCLYKTNVAQTAQFLKASGITRDVFECVSGKSADCYGFNQSESGIMVCTTVLAAGVSFSNVSRVYFQDGSHGPEVFLQGAGRGARAEGEQCEAFLVTSKQQLNYFQRSTNCPQASSMATFCKDCFEKGLHFGRELYKMFDHDDVEENPGNKRSSTQQSIYDNPAKYGVLKTLQQNDQQPQTFQVSTTAN